MIKKAFSKQGASCLFVYNSESGIFNLALKACFNKQDLFYIEVPNQVGFSQLFK